MSFSDIFKRAFLEGYASTQIDAKHIVVALSITAVISVFIFFVYRFMTKKTFYSKTFAICLVSVSLVTAAIIFTIQSSIVISLGMVGALSIVRFRTAVKDPMDLLFLFWSISVGIICGAGLAELAVILSIILTVVIIVLDQIPVIKTPMLLVVRSCDVNIESKIDSVIKKYCKHYNVKSRNIVADNINFVIELRVSEQAKLLSEISALDSVMSASLLSHDGEVTY